MRPWSDDCVDGEPIPSRHAAGRPEGEAVGFSDNLGPHLASREAPAATRSFALVGHDFAVPSRGDDVDRADREVPADLPRVDFFHGVRVTCTLNRRLRGR